ncbi:MAG: RtcB family protein [Patescibacteria group bacterium]|nr:RtcB family protein [Patescibacteria group bacterium]
MSNYKVIMPTHGVPIKAWVKGVPVETEAVSQLCNIASMPFIYKHVAVMPDVHLGIGATVGSVIATQGAVIPAAVGVDLGCGMVAVQTSLKASDLPDTLQHVRGKIEAAVPHGRTANGGPGDRGAWGDPPPKVLHAWGDLFARFQKILTKHPTIEKSNNLNHLGTLGTGNHFIEVCLDEGQNVWVMLHSGSRGVGGRIGSYFIELAKEDMRKWFINLPDKDLAYLPEGTTYFNDYLEAVSWAQDFAMQNRQIMLGSVLDVLHKTVKPFEIVDKAINCHHNYVARENHFGSNVIVTRKGAVQAREGTMGIIPGSMGAKSYIVRGKGNPDSFCSCSHGAGRRMSRGAAKKAFTLEDHALATAGVECRKDLEVIDETPGAYKDIDSVMAAQEDLVDIVATLKQVLCVKG